MLRKMLILGLSFFAANPVFADNISYVGAGIGYQTGKDYGGFLPQLFGGAGVTFGCERLYYLGGEIFAGALSMPVSGSNTNRILWDFGFSFMPGFFLNADNVMFAKLGLQTVNVYHNSSNITGINLGFGIQHSLRNNLDLRAEYVYFSDGFTNSLLKVRANNFNLALVYRIS